MLLKFDIRRLMIHNFDVRRLDFYRKVPKDLTQPTITGAVISITCITFMLTLFISELLHFLSGEIVSEFYVDNPGESNERIPVYIKISLPRLKCDYVGLDIQDDLGRHEVGFIENTVKNPIGEEGCLFEANFLINKVPGNFHVSTHSADQQPENIDFGHVIHEVRFGSKIDNPNVPGTFNPLYGRAQIDGNALESHDYVMKVVPTIYEESSGKQLVSYQYSYAYRSYISFSHGGRVVPAVWFRYDLTPITVKYHRKRPPFYSFITTVCAIVGGTFTVAGIIDSFLFTASEIFRKLEIGKQG
ncbi:endoplasmic reticulum-Golgi intermediate compartment protein 1-like [Panulirus ornatus]|uniref:endoplasmic reticulum-Golgi intermediate compartment protein 1-like n=1 Tax=Panulirus ornatus TaxID=150431 RepID=UPI003A83E029